MLHALQFWINLPSKVKKEDPEYLAVAASDIPELELPNHAGILRVLIGTCGERSSPVKTYTRQFMYHLKLNPKSAFTFHTKAELEYAAFVPNEEVIINDNLTGKSHLLAFSKDNGDIELYNPGITIEDLFIFGGEEYTEPVIAEGPFVMNSRKEIAQAYNDFFAGKYETIS